MFFLPRQGTKPEYTSPGSTAKVVCFEMPTPNPLPQTFLLEVLQPADALHCHCSGKRTDYFKI